MGEIADDSAAAVAEQIAVASEEELGFPPLLLNGVAVPAIVTEMSADEVFALGGTAEGGGFSAVLPKSAVPDKPDKWTPIEARGMQLEVMRVESGVAHWLVSAGDPVKDQ